MQPSCLFDSKCRANFYVSCAHICLAQFVAVRHFSISDVPYGVMHTVEAHLHYETLETRARPARVAILVDSSDVDWHHSALRVIELLSSIWGGKHSVIIPTDGSKVDPVFWAVLERFSPDYVFVYRKTGADIRLSHPGKYAAHLKDAISRYGSESFNSDLERHRIDSELQRNWADTFHLSAGLRSQLAARLVPFHYQENFDPVTSNGYTPHELTKIIDVLNRVERPKSFCSFQVPHEIEAIWWAAYTGVYPLALADQLRDLAITEEVIKVSGEDVGDFARWVAGLGYDKVSSKINEIVGDKTEFTPPDRVVLTPFDISVSCLGLYGSPLSSRDIADNFAIVTGDSLSDFCLSYNLPRIGHRAAWLPSAWIDALTSQGDSALRSSVFSVIFAIPYNVRQDKGVKVCSLSKDNDQILGSFEIIKKHTGFGLNGERIDTIDALKLAEEQAPRLTPYCIDSPNHSEIYPFLGDRSVGAIRSPRPNGFSKLSATHHRWVSEVSARSRAVPTLPHIAEKLVIPPQPSGTIAVRVSNEALAYVCPGSFLIIGDDINANLLNPEIGLFDTFTAVSLIASAKGHSCQLSDKGIYQRDSFVKFGDVFKTASILKRERSRAVFEKFLDHTKRQKGIYDEGCVLDAEKRTYLDLSATQKLMGGDQDAAIELLDSLVASKITYRGYVLGCAACKYVGWYSLAELTDEYRCARCGRVQMISRQNWKVPAAPQVFYKLDEIVYQFLKHDGDVVALGLDYMARNSKHPFNYSPEIEFRDKDSTLLGEIDFCAVFDGVLTIGEAKKQGELASSGGETRAIAEKYSRLSEMLHARRVLFCTTSREWKFSTVETVQRAFDGKLARPTFVAGDDLMGKSRT
jgi:hypothetical protein